MSPVAVIPSMRGIRTSITTTSGRSRSVAATASPPSAASPTTSISGWMLSRARKPARISG
jgi:hypothetical protein